MISTAAPWIGHDREAPDGRAVPGAWCTLPPAAFSFDHRVHVRDADVADPGTWRAGCAISGREIAVRRRRSRRRNESSGTGTPDDGIVAEVQLTTCE